MRKLTYFWRNASYIKIAVVISGFLITPLIAQTKTVAFNDWVYGINDDGAHIGLTESTNYNNTYIAFLCDPSSQTIEVVFSVTKTENRSDFVVLGSDYPIKVQIDSNPVIQLKVLAYSAAATSVYGGTAYDKLVNEMFQGISMKVEWNYKGGDVAYPKFSLLGATASYLAVLNNCTNTGKNEGFVTPSTRSEYDQMVDEGFVTPNESKYNY